MLQVIVSGVLFKVQDSGLQYLLKRVGSRYLLPATDLQENEALEAAVNRLAAGLINRQNIHWQQLHTYGEASLPLRVVYLGALPADAAPTGVEGYAWFPVGSPSRLGAQETHILEAALQELRDRAVEGRLLFSFLPMEFTLGELQQVWELIHGEKVDKRNFRRRIKATGLVELTRKQRSGQGRPARIYRLQNTRL